MMNYLYKVVTGERRGLIPFVLRIFLLACSLLYGAIVFVMTSVSLSGLLPRRKLSRPVISVGNITTGGVGKTPLVIMIAQYLLSEKCHPAILIRGYMPSWQKKGQTPLISDEAEMLKGFLPGVAVGVGRDRVKSAGMILEQQPVDLFILDDGFQQWRLVRDLDIVAIDSTQPFGNSYLLPRGFLREHKWALSRAHIFVLTKSDGVGSRVREIRNILSDINPTALLVVTVHLPVSLTRIVDQEIVLLPVLKDRRIVITSSIGDPKSFLTTLRKLGADIQQKHVFMDHHDYSQDEIENIAQQARQEGLNCLVTTSKDAVKLKPFLQIFAPDIEVLALNIRMEIVEGQNEFFHRIDSLLQR